MRNKLLILLSFLQVALNGQTALISDPLSIRNDYGYELIGRLRDRILLFRDRFDEFQVQAFDNQMHLSWSRDLNDLERKGIQIIAVVPGRNDFSVVHKIRKRGHTYLRVHKYDPGANLIDTMTVKDYGERIFMPPTLGYVKSDDRNCMVVYNDAEREKLELVCFQLDKMQVLWENTVNMDIGDRYEPDPFELTLGNSGDFFMITEKNNKRSKIENHHFRVLHVNAKGDQVSEIQLGDYITLDAKFAVDNLNKKLTAVGLWGEKNKDRTNGCFFASMPFVPGAATAVHYESFDEKFLSILRQKDVEEGARGVSDSEIKTLALRQDGGAVMVVERNHEIQRGSAAGRGFMREGIRLIVDYYYDDMYVIGFHPDGRTHWKTVLHKKQYSQDDEGTFSSFFLHLGIEEIRLLFNDEIKYENTCSEYVLSPVGEFDRNGILNTMNQGLRMRFRDAIQMNASECLVPSEFRNKLRLVLFRF
ncbi:MAG: hypothetical protein JNJ57_16700 [Saprospiraceae bacterium]|nr:hypothetical protein [Saprospiraceae bacterium]